MTSEEFFNLIKSGVERELMYRDRGKDNYYSNYKNVMAFIADKIARDGIEKYFNAIEEWE